MQASILEDRANGIIEHTQNLSLTSTHNNYSCVVSITTSKVGSKPQFIPQQKNCQHTCIIYYQEFKNKRYHIEVPSC